MQRRTAATLLILIATSIVGQVFVRSTLAQDAEKAAPAEVIAAGQPAMAANPPRALAGDSLLIMACTALALLMTPALGLFYGGMVRRKNVLATFQQSFILLGFLGFQWVLIGYTLAFGPDVFAGLCGGWQWFGLMGVGLEPDAPAAP